VIPFQISMKLAGIIGDHYSQTIMTIYCPNFIRETTFELMTRSNF
jgi:hypothetical protein